MKIFKKVISVFVASCFMLSILNLPIYSAQNTIETIRIAQDQDGTDWKADYKTVKKVTETRQKSSKIAKGNTKPKATTIKESSKVKKLAKQNINAINKLLKKKGISKLAKKWLTKAKVLINNVKNGKKTNSQKETLLKKAMTAIKKVTKAKGSDLSLAQQTRGVFISLKSVLKNNLTYKIYSKYTTKGITIFKKLANKLRLALKIVYNSFVKMGVTKAQINKIYSPLLKMIKRGVDLSNCASLAVASYLGIKTNYAALQNLAADISLNVDYLVKYFSKEKELIATCTDAELKVLQKNGHKNATNYDVTLKEFMSGLKVGEKSLLYVECFDGDEHAMTVKRVKKGFAVYDVMVAEGAVRIYSAKEFKKLMSGKKVKVTGKDSKGNKRTMTVYFKAVINKKMGDGYVTTDSKGIAKQDLQKSSIYKLIKQRIASINRILKSSTISSTAKNWLRKAKEFINKVINGNKSNEEKKSLLAKASDVLANVLVQKSVLSIIQTYSWSKVFSSFKSILKNDIVYKVYNKYGEKGVNLVNAISKKYKLSQNEIYEQFVKNSVTKKDDIGIFSDIVLYQINNNEDIFNDIDYRWGRDKSIYNTLMALKNLVDSKVTKTNTIAASPSAPTAASSVKVKTAKKTVKKKTVSLTSKIIGEYKQTGLNVLKGLASKLKLKLSTVYDSFVKLGVTKEQMDKVGEILLNLMKKGENFVCCASLAVARYLNININLTALQNLAADISFNFFPSLNGFGGTTGEATVKVIALHGKKNVDNLTCTYEDLINGLKKGKRVMVGIDCLNRSGNRVSGHVITVIKEKSGYAVYDTLSNGGNKVIYSAAEFKKFMNGKKAVGKTDSGTKIVKPVYYTDTSSGVIRYKIINSWEIKVSADTTKFVSYSVRSLYNKSISIIKKFSKNKTAGKWLKNEKKSINKIISNGNKTNSQKGQLLEKEFSILNLYKKSIDSINSLLKTKGINKTAENWLKNEKKSINKIVNNDNKTNSQKGQLLEKEFSILNLYKKSIDSINSLLKTKGINKTAKNWLNKAKNLIDKTIGSNKSTAAKQTWLNKVVSALKTISNQKVSVLSLVKQTVSGVFSSLKNVLEKNLTYKIYAKYGTDGVNLINEFAKKYSLKQESIYEQFEEYEVTKEQVSEIVNALNTINQKEEGILLMEKRKNEPILDSIKIEYCKDIENSNSLFKNSVIGNIIKELTKKELEDVVYNEKIKNNIIYKMYKAYGEDGTNLIVDFSKKYNLGQETIYNQFVNNGITKEEVTETASVVENIEWEKKHIAQKVKQSSDVSVSIIVIYNKLKENNSLFQKSNVATAMKQLVGDTINSEIMNETIENSVTYRVYTKYGKVGVSLIEELSDHLKLSKDDIYVQFVKNGVSKETVSEYYLKISDEIDKNSDLFACVWADESINNAFAAIKELMGDITIVLLAA